MNEATEQEGELPTEELFSLDQLSEEDRNKLINYGLLLQQFFQSDKFRSYIELNYDIVQDPEKKHLFVVEVPDDVAHERAMKMAQAQVRQAPTIVGASKADLQRMLKKKNKK